MHGKQLNSWFHKSIYLIWTEHTKWELCSDLNAFHTSFRTLLNNKPLQYLKVREKMYLARPRLQLNGLLQLLLLFKLSWRRAESVIYSSVAATGWIRVTNQSVCRRIITKSPNITACQASALHPTKRKLKSSISPLQAAAAAAGSWF